MIEQSCAQNLSKIDLANLDLQEVGLFKNESLITVALNLFKDGFALLQEIDNKELQPFALKLLRILQQASNEMQLQNQDYIEFLIQSLQMLISRKPE